MTAVTVNIVGGTQAQNTTAVTVGAVRWGANGTANFGQTQNVAEGTYTLTVYKTTAPTQISITVQVYGNVAAINITVNDDTISVNNN